MADEVHGEYFIDLSGSGIKKRPKGEDAGVVDKNGGVAKLRADGFSCRINGLGTGDIALFKPDERMR